MWAAAIDDVRVRGDSCGGDVTCVIRSCPKGLGSPVFDKLEAELCKAFMSLPASKVRCVPLSPTQSCDADSAVVWAVFSTASISEGCLQHNTFDSHCIAVSIQVLAMTGALNRACITRLLNSSKGVRVACRVCSPVISSSMLCSVNRCEQRVRHPAPPSKWQTHCGVHQR